MVQSLLPGSCPGIAAALAYAGARAAHAPLADGLSLALVTNVAFLPTGLALSGEMLLAGLVLVVCSAFGLRRLRR